VSASNLISGSTNLNNVFEPVHQRLSLTSDVARGSTPSSIPGFNWTAGISPATYEATYFGRLRINNSAGAVVFGMSVPSGATGNAIVTFGTPTNPTIRMFTTDGTTTTATFTYAASASTADWPFSIKAYVTTSGSTGTVSLLAGGNNAFQTTYRAGSFATVTRIS
jgi:hypothetical protein